jgi:hypothetical protein
MEPPDNPIFSSVHTILSNGSESDYICAIESGTNNLFCSSSDVVRSSPPEKYKKVLQVKPCRFQTVVIDADGKLGGWDRKNELLHYIPDDLEVKAIATDNATALAIKMDNTVVAFGSDGKKQISGIPPGLKAKAITSSLWTCHAIKEDDTIVGWGHNASRLLDIPPGLKAKAIASSPFAVVIIGLDDKLYGWGWSSVISRLPKDITATHISISMDHGLYIGMDGQVGAWGEWTANEINVPKGLKAKSISAGTGCSFAVTMDGKIVCWGKKPDIGNPPWVTFYETTPAVPAIPAESLGDPTKVPMLTFPPVKTLDNYIPPSVPTGFEVRPTQSVNKLGIEEISPIYVTTLPAGTVLFRGINTLIQLTQDVAGLSNNGKFCCNPNFSVYFYPFPFIDQTVSEFKHYAIYTVSRDIKVACFISPAPLARADRHIDGFPIVSCDKIPKSECGEIPKTYDACFTEAFRILNPDVVGMIGIASIDRHSLIDHIKGGEFDDKYYNTYLDSHSLIPGVPEIVLYPFKGPLMKPYTQTIPNYGEYLTKFQDILNFKPLKVIKRELGIMHDTIDALMSADGLDGNHMKVNKETGFFQILELSTAPFPIADTPRFTDPAFRFVRPAPGLPGAELPSGNGR